MSPKTCIWKGANGKAYDFYIYALPCRFDPGQVGNYIYARRNDRRLWVPIYIGEGDLAERSSLTQHHRRECIQSKGATHFHCHRNPRREHRLSEEADLLERYTNALHPRGCNRKK
ncbi:hypothetical protein [Candidatus Palauibacter sp.]|uniref:hypothetical protein n=1 Tax=Candidatus Palauibacter sp. TaxID=3101350 RepID=UPI003B5B1F55